MKVGVTGGRVFQDRPFAFRCLDAWHARRPISLLVEGGAAGADTLAWKWARSRGVPTMTHLADWWLDGNLAGRMRNVDMQYEEQPDAWIVLPGGVGTAHMVRTAHVFGELIRPVLIWDAELESIPI